MCLYLCTWMQVPMEARGVGSPGTGIIGSCESPDMGLNSGPLQEQHVVSTTVLSLHTSPTHLFLMGLFPEKDLNAFLASMSIQLSSNRKKVMMTWEEMNKTDFNIYDLKKCYREGGIQLTKNELEDKTSSDQTNSELQDLYALPGWPVQSKRPA